MGQPKWQQLVQVNERDHRITPGVKELVGNYIGPGANETDVALWIIDQTFISVSSERTVSKITAEYYRDQVWTMLTG